VFKELGRRFEKSHDQVKVRFNFAGSQQLLAQLDHGAPADVFAPASPAEMKLATEKGLIDTESHDTFAYNRLVLISPEAAPVKSLKQLAEGNGKLVVAHTSVPAGRYTRSFFQSIKSDPELGADLVSKIEARIVSEEENVRSVLAKVRLGEADAGFVYQTDANTGGIFTLPLPGKHSPLASYPIAMIKTAKAPALAREFIAYVLSKDGQQVLHDHGFMITNEVR
ncbi:MAG TPA: molybdate ABC transporter substrate-binding protein, partial [Planctomycetota bacterium]|nr:molybdate ABC transporter substrate-binding protein [Planctomycetota bacterium]